jgi:hypothetical protein
MVFVGAPEIPVGAEVIEVTFTVALGAQDVRPRQPPLA